jgi:hypothetical protein
MERVRYFDSIRNREIILVRNGEHSLQMSFTHDEFMLMSEITLERTFLLLEVKLAAK